MINKLASIQKRNKQTTYIQSPHSFDTFTMNTQAPLSMASYTGQGVQEQFNRNVTRARLQIQKIRQNNVAIQAIRTRYEQSVMTQQEKNCSAQVDIILNENSVIHQNIKQLIEAMKRDIQTSMNATRYRDQPQTVMKKNMLMGITNQFTQTLNQQKAHEDFFKNTVKNKIMRQAKIVDPTLNDVQLEHYANNPHEASQLLQKRVGIASFQLRNAVQDIQDKCRDIERLERSVNEVLMLFKQLSEMVFAQGAMIDNIQYHVRDARDYVQKADVQIVQVKQKRDCRRKCCCWTVFAIVVVVIIVVAIAVPLGIKFAKG